MINSKSLFARIKLGCNIFLVSFSFLLFSCDENKNTIYSVSGRLVMDCEGNEPYANQTINLYSIKSNNSKKGRLNVLTETDENGNFVFNYKKPKGLGYSGILSLNNILNYIPGSQNIDLGTFNIKHKPLGQVTIEIENEYTINDTLFIRDQFNNPFNYLYVMPGPFHDTIFPTDYGHVLGELNYDDGKFSTILSAHAFIRSSTGLGKEFYKELRLENCNKDPLVVKLIID